MLSGVEGPHASPLMVAEGALTPLCRGHPVRGGKKKGLKICIEMGVEVEGLGWGKIHTLSHTHKQMFVNKSSQNANCPTYFPPAESNIFAGGRQKSYELQGKFMFDLPTHTHTLTPAHTRSGSHARRIPRPWERRDKCVAVVPTPNCSLFFALPPRKPAAETI